MKPLAELRRRRGRSARLLFDIDDTLTTEGQLTAAAYAALERLHDAGLLVVPITGRPAGWCDHIARMWPVDAVVGENGAFYFCLRRGGAPAASSAIRTTTRRARRTARGSPRCATRVLARGARAARSPPTSPTARPTSRSTICEDVPPPALRPASSASWRSCDAAGMTTKVSSIHVNGWFGDYDKLAMTRRSSCASAFGVDLDARARGLRVRRRLAQRCADVRVLPALGGGRERPRFAAHRLEHAPAYVTEAASGAGFVELAERLLRAAHE